MKKSVIFAAIVAGLLVFGVKAETCTVTNVVVAPLTDAHWIQGAPYNQYTPHSSWLSGCEAISSSQELLVWKWPWRLGAIHTASHYVNGESDSVLRFDGSVPFDWDSILDSYGGSTTLRQKHEAARLSLMCQSLLQMQYVSGGGDAKKQIPGTMEWYEYVGSVKPNANGGDDAAVAAVRADFEFGSPVQVGVPQHAVVGLGYATGTNSVGASVDLIWLNYGWGGGSDGWYDLRSTEHYAESGLLYTASPLQNVHVGFRPIKSVQIEPVAPVSGNSVTLNWHLPNCYTNKISGFTVAKKKLGTTTTTWSDDFSTVKGRSSNTNEVRIVNGALKAWDGTASGMYIWDEVFEPTADSVLSYDVGSSHMSGMSVRFEARVDGVWQSFHTVVVNGGKETNYYNWGTTTPADPVSLASFAGKKIQLRFVVEYTTGGIFTSDDASMKIDNLSISNIKTFETVSTDSTIAASARSTTFSDLTTGETYAFTVTPIMSDNSAAVTQTATTTIGTPAATPTIDAVTMSPRGANLVQEGFYADIAMGWNIIDVACSESVTSLEAFISHQSVLPQSKIEVVDNGSGSFSINIDATEVAAKWANQKMILTLKATNATGESAYKDVELCLKASGVPENVPGGKVWTGEDALDGEDYTVKWSGGLPSDGDKVTFLAADGEYGAKMNLNLSSATTLGYVYVTGEEQLTISGTSSETLTANVLKNDIQVEINSSKFKVNTAIPSTNIVIDSGSCLDCEIDQSRSGWIKKATYGYPSALTDSSLWNGTVVFSGYSADWLNPSSYGNTSSKVRFNGVAGYLAHSNPTFNPTIELVDNGSTPAFDWNNGSSASTATFKGISGDGTFKTSGSSATSERIVINDIGDFAGSFNLASKVVTIGTTKGVDASNGRLNFNSGYGATIAGGKTWTIGGGVYLAGSQTLTVNGALSDSGALSADGTGTVLALAPAATVSATSFSFADNTIRLAMTADASPTFSVTGAANLTNATIEVALADGMSVGDSIALMSAGSFEGVDSATLEGLDGYSLEVSGGTLYATKDIPPTPATSLEESEGFVTSESQLAFKDATLAMLTSEALGGKFGGDWAGTADGADVVFNNFDRTSEAAGTITCQAQVANDGYVKGVLLTFTQSGDGVYVLMTGAKYIQGASLGDSIAGGSDASQGGEWKYAVSALSLKYLGPAPTAVWVAGEFDDDRSAHGGLEISLNGNTTNALGQIVIGSSTTLGATIAISDGFDNATMLVKYEIPSGGAPAANSVPASMFVTYDMGAYASNGASALDGYWWNNSQVKSGYAFSSSAPSIPLEGYLLISVPANSEQNPGNHYTAVYVGETVTTLSGGEASGLRFTGPNNRVTSVGIGGPTVAGANPWQGMIIKSVAIFDEWIVPTDLATYRFPGQGAVLPEDSDLYAIEPVAKWVNDFKTTEKNGCTLSVSGTTAAKDDSFGGTLSIGDASAEISTTNINSKSLSVLVKYRSMPDNASAPVVAFGGQAAVGYDVGAYAKTNGELGVYRTYKHSGTDYSAKFDITEAPCLSMDGGYLFCSRNDNACRVYAASEIDDLAGGEITSNITFSDIVIKTIGIGGSTSYPDSSVSGALGVFTGFVVEKVVVFNGYYTPDQIRYVENPEDGDTVNIASGATWNFAAGETRTYTSVGTLSSGGTIAITNASTLAEGTYKLAEWTTPQQYTTQCAGYGKVGTLVADGLASGLSARLVYGARAIYLRVDDTAKQTARKPLVVWCYGDSITEGYNAQATGANYRILLYQKLEMLGYNVRSTGVYGLSNNHDSVDPTGTPLTDQYKWHSAKHGATAGPTTLAHRSNLSENVDTLAIQAGTPDVALLLIGVNDIPEWKNEADRVTPVLKAWTNVVNRMVKNLPDTKIVVSTILYSDGTRTDIDPTITAINTQIKNLFDNLPAEWQGHVVLADLNSIVKSGDPGIIYSDHLHPDWWGYDQMADGYLEKIVECYPNPDATDFPSQNPIPAAPTANQLGAANKPELAAYRAGFTKLCNIRVEKGQDVSNVVYDDMNSAAATNNLEKVGYFVEFVRDDNHAHKWVWVDMDAFGDADLASVGLPQRIYQQAVTKMHVCSNHGAIDNVAADDDSVTGWIEFSPYNYDRAGSNSTAPANYGEPFDWNDTLSESGSYGCMQVFRVMNPSSRNLYERPQLMFAFNNFQSANSNPADFGIGNFAQHFNCNNSYHTEDWTGVGGTLAKMAPDAYSVKTIEIWTKSSTPVYVRDNIVKRADGTVYHGNDENRAIITNWEYQINRPLAPPAPNTIDILYVLDKPSREYIENTKNMSLDEFFAKSTAFMNQMLCPTDMDTNFWFRMVGVYPLDVQAQAVSPMLARSKNSSEPGFELVNEMRNRVGADIVFSVSRNGGGIGGLAYVNSYENIMSGAAAPLGHACGFLEYSQMIAWVHEIAHVMSCNHTPPDNIDVNNPRHRQFGVVVHDDNATEEPFYYRTIMTGWYYGGQTYCFSSKNHYYNGVQLSVSNHVDATQVMVELAPYVAQWRPTKVPERPEITFFPQDQAEIPAGVETMVTINYSDPDAEIYWYDATSGEGKSDAHPYTGPISVVGGTWKMLYAFAKTNGVEVAESEKTATYFLTGMYGRFDYSQVLDSDGITWSMPLGDSSDFAWDKDTSVFCAGESSYQAHVDMESLTNSRPSTCSATALLTLTEARNLNFRHLDTYTNAMFSVWVDDVPVYYKKGASDTGGEWRKEVIRVESGTHRIEFVFTQTAEDRVDAQTSEGDEHTLVDDEKYQRYIASLEAAKTSRVWIDGFEWTPTDMIWAGDEATGDGVWTTDTAYAPWEGGMSFVDDAVVTFPDLAAGSATVAVKGEVRPSKVNFTGANTAYTFVPQDDNAFIYISDGVSTEFKTNAAIRVPFRLDAAYISSAAKCTLELGNVFGHGLTGPGSEGSFWGQVRVNSKSTVIMNPGAGRTQTVGDFGKNWSYTDSDLVFTNGTVKVNGAINGGNGLFQYKRIHVKDGALLELVTTDATGYDVAANNTIEVERGAELRIDAGDRLRRPMKLSGGKLTVSRSGSVHALALYNNPSFTVTADSVLTNGNAAATLGFVGQDATITLQNNATLDCYVPFANGIMDGDSKNVTISGNGTFVQNALMIQFTNKVTVANGVTFRQNAVTSGTVGKSSWDVNGTLEANAIMQVSALTLASGATLSVKVTDANLSNAAILCDATPSLSGSIVVNAASDLANGKYAVISATGIEDGIIARVSAPTLAKRATFAVEEGGLFMIVADYTEGAFTDTDYPVPYSWMMDYYPNLRGNPSDFTELQALQPAASAAHSVWECYVLGLDPTNETSKFLATIRMEGRKPIVEYSPTNTALGNITYVLQGRPALSNDWQNVEFDEPGDTNRFFRVRVTW